MSLWRRSGTEYERSGDVPVVIFRFQHCVLGGQVLSLDIPAKCKTCGHLLQPDDFILPPICLFPPWITSSRAPGSIVIKPTVGGFLNDYRGLEDLHVGVADSNGCVTHYLHDYERIQVDNTWRDCISIPISERLSDLALHPDGRNQEWCRWDNTLGVHVISFRQQTLKTRSVDRNCFDFVWGFILAYWNSVDSDFKDHIEMRCSSKECFTEHFVLPAIDKILQFKRIYRVAVASAQ